MPKLKRALPAFWLGARENGADPILLTGLKSPITLQIRLDRALDLGNRNDVIRRIGRIATREQPQRIQRHAAVGSEPIERTRQRADVMPDLRWHEILIALHGGNPCRRLGECQLQQGMLIGSLASTTGSSLLSSTDTCWTCGTR